MKLELASHSAIRYACLNYHYSKSIPANCIGFSVFNDNMEWCGVILYGTGANQYIARPFGLKQGQVIELVRMALNGKQESTSKALAISLKLIPKLLPMCKLIVSYADIDQNHNGTIYQATNWIYLGKYNEGSRSAFIVHGKKVHPKSIHSKGVKQNINSVRKYLDKNAKEFYTKGKHKYIFVIDKSLRHLYSNLKKQYPKNAAVA